MKSTRWRKLYDMQIFQSARALFDRLGSRLFAALQEVLEPILSKEGVKRGLLFGLGSILILGVLILLLVHPSTFSPAEITLVSILILMSVTAIFIMDLFD
jgi:hypothetical protein